MSVNYCTQGFKLEVGSTVQILTTAAAEPKAGIRKKYKDYSDHKDFKEHKVSKKKHKDSKEICESSESKDCIQHKEPDVHQHHADFEGVFTGIVLDKTELKLMRDPDSPSRSSEHDRKNDKDPLNIDEEVEFIVLSLTKASPPFTAGQIVWFQVDEIVALSVLYNQHA